MYSIKKTLGWSFRVAVSIALLYAIASRINLSVVGALFQNARIVPLVIAWALIGGTLFAGTYRWHLIIRGMAQNEIKFSFRTLLQYYVSGFFYSMFIPGGQLVGEAMKGWRGTRNEKEKSVFLLSILNDRLAGFAGLALLLFFVYIVEPYLRGIAIFRILTALGAGVGVISFILLLCPAVLTSMLRFIARGVGKFLRIPGAVYAGIARLPATVTLASVVGPIALGIFVHLLAAGALIMTAQAISISISFQYALWVYIIAGIAAFVPISFAGFGVREAVFVYFFGFANIPQEAALALSLLFGISHMIVALSGFIIEMSILFKRRPPAEPASP